MTHAMLMCCQAFDLNNTQRQREPVMIKLRSSSGGHAGAFLTAVPGGRMALGNDMFAVSVWHRLGQRAPAEVARKP